jgi:hypothetical protein
LLKDSQTTEIIQFTQDICLDPTCSHTWMRTSIYEYALPKQGIIFNNYGGQINLMDGPYYISRFAKGRNKKEIEVPTSLVDMVIQMNATKKEIEAWLTFNAETNHESQLPPKGVNLSDCGSDQKQKE